MLLFPLRSHHAHLEHDLMFFYLNMFLAVATAGLITLPQQYDKHRMIITRRMIMRIIFAEDLNVLYTITRAIYIISSIYIYELKRPTRHD